MFMLGTENAVGGGRGSLAVYAILFWFKPSPTFLGHMIEAMSDLHILLDPVTNFWKFPKKVFFTYPLNLGEILTFLNS